MPTAKDTVDYLRAHSLILTTVESCTAGMIVMSLSEVEGSGEFIECGYVVYSPQAKQRLLHVDPTTIAKFNLTSVEVAQEMAIGALRDSSANVAVATTGLLGPDDMDGIPAGTICFAWAFQTTDEQIVFSREVRFSGNRGEVRSEATEYALKGVQQFHRCALKVGHGSCT